jgi:hypothetical protein
LVLPGEQVLAAPGLLLLLSVVPLAPLGLELDGLLPVVQVAMAGRPPEDPGLLAALAPRPHHREPALQAVGRPTAVACLPGRAIPLVIPSTFGAQETFASASPLLPVLLAQRRVADGALLRLMHEPLASDHVAQVTLQTVAGIVVVKGRERVVAVELARATRTPVLVIPMHDHGMGPGVVWP